jgi:hypothetical protein
MCEYGKGNKKGVRHKQEKIESISVTNEEAPLKNEEN